jgi:hypothetical protein
LIFLRPVVLRNTAAADANARDSVERLKLNKENARLLEEITGTPLNTGERKDQEAAGRTPDPAR